MFRRVRPRRIEALTHQINRAPPAARSLPCASEARRRGAAPARRSRSPPRARRTWCARAPRTHRCRSASVPPRRDRRCACRDASPLSSSLLSSGLPPPLAPFSATERESPRPIEDSSPREHKNVHRSRTFFSSPPTAAASSLIVIAPPASASRIFCVMLILPSVLVEYPAIRDLPAAAAAARCVSAALHRGARPPRFRSSADRRGRWRSPPPPRAA
jgi:hypothetical protein